MKRCYGGRAHDESETAMQRMTIRTLLAATALAGSVSLAACATAQTAPEAASPTVAALVGTQPTGRGEANKAVLVLDAARPADSIIVATAGLAGLEIYGLDGRRRGAVPAGEAGSIDVRQGVAVNGRAIDLLVSTDTTDNSLRGRGRLLLPQRRRRRPVCHRGRRRGGVRPASGLHRRDREGGRAPVAPHRPAFAGRALRRR
jgi:hypothetical protein